MFRLLPRVQRIIVDVQNVLLSLPYEVFGKTPISPACYNVVLSAQSLSAVERFRLTA